MRKTSSAGACESVRLREVSVLWDVRLKRYYCTVNFTVNCPCAGDVFDEIKVLRL